jgi:hypothetical protein
MSQSPTPPETTVPNPEATPKREYRRPELEDLGSVQDVTSAGGSNGLADGTYRS